jgi:hypothetical protein
MKLSNSFVTAGFAALALAGATVLGTAESAQSLGLTFSPAGTQLDKDKILDISANPSAPIVFTLQFDTSQMDQNGIINEIVLNFGYDNMELLAPAGTPAPGVSSIYDVLSSSMISTVLADAAPYSVPSVGSNSGAIPPTYKKSLAFSNLNFGANTGSYDLATVSFLTAADLPSNGIRDFYTLLTRVNGTVAGGEANEFVQSSIDNGNPPRLYSQVEVQAKAIPTPALLPGLVAFGMSLVRKRKQEQAV